MARFLRFLPAALFWVVTASFASLAWAVPQAGNPQQSAQAPVQPSKPPEIPIDSQSLGKMLTLPDNCFTMRVVPGDPNVDKWMAQKPPDQQTDFTMQIVPAPQCVVPGVAAAAPQGTPPVTYDLGVRWTPLPTERTFAPFIRIPDIRTIPIFPFPTLPLFPPVIPQETPVQDGTAPR